jgi:hypothetical protein
MSYYKVVHRMLFLLRSGVQWVTYVKEFQIIKAGRSHCICRFVNDLQII